MDLQKRVKELQEFAQISSQGAMSKAIEALDEVKATSKAAISKGSLVKDVAIERISATTTSLGVASVTIANALKDLPKTFEELAQEMPKIARKMQNAGMHDQGQRSGAEAMEMFDKIPTTSKLGEDYKGALERFLYNDNPDLWKHGSHIVPHSKGGAATPNNIMWETIEAGGIRGNAIMTGGEQLYIRISNAIESIVENSGAIAKLGFDVTLTATLTQVTVVALSYSLDLYRGDITVQEYRSLVLDTAKRVGISTPIVFVTLIAVCALLPELGALLAAPAVVAGLNALLGISIATPLVQSLVRHLNAGGFGEAASNYYRQLQEKLQACVNQTVSQVPLLKPAGET
ncbi:HNH endonuclease [Pseudanabaenaceae cyanobacterium LEGE 13415]|nr:HNH endonuclease [Pseudanabaenaceae cyanobacterium LEGE 13415]